MNWLQRLFQNLRGGLRLRAPESVLHDAPSQARGTLYGGYTMQEASQALRLLAQAWAAANASPYLPITPDEAHTLTTQEGMILILPDTPW